MYCCGKVSSDQDYSSKAGGVAVFTVCANEGNFVAAAAPSLRPPQSGRDLGWNADQGVALGWYSVGPLALRVVVVTLSLVGGYGLETLG